jgi:hypothetical protein
MYSMRLSYQDNLWLVQAYNPSPKNCVIAKWDLGVYVQGKLIKLDDMGHPLTVCYGALVPLKNAEVTVEIPDETVESPKDYRPLSIFTAGSVISYNCDPKPLPSDLPEVRKILADKGSTRPFYANADEKIVEI